VYLTLTFVFKGFSNTLLYPHSSTPARTKVFRMPNEPAPVCARRAIDWEVVQRAMVCPNRWGTLCSGCRACANDTEDDDDINARGMVSALYSRVISPPTPNGAARLAAYGAETCNTPVRVFGFPIEADENIVIQPPPRLIRQHRSAWSLARSPRDREEFMAARIAEEWQRDWTINQN